MDHSKLSFQTLMSRYSGKPTSLRNNGFISYAKKSFQPKEEDMKLAFQKFDTNKDVKVSLEEYKAAVRVLDRGIGDSDAVKAFRIMDSDGDGLVDFKEFMEMFNGMGTTIETEIKNALKGEGKTSSEDSSQILKWSVTERNQKPYETEGQKCTSFRVI